MGRVHLPPQLTLGDLGARRELSTAVLGGVRPKNEFDALF